MYSLLIVDDAPATAENLASDIPWQDIGIDEVRTAYSARQALEVLAQSRIDIVISDIHMPEMDGIEFITKLMKTWPFTKVLVYSAYDDFKYAQRTIELGVVAYLTKPTAYGQILGEVEQAIRRIEQQLRDIQIVQDAEEMLLANAPAITQLYLSTVVIQGVLDDEQALEWITTRCGLDRQDPCFLLLVRIDRYDFLRAPTFEGLKVSIQGYVKRVLFPEASTICFWDQENHLVSILHAKTDAELHAMKNYMTKVIDTLSVALENSHGVSVSMFWDEDTHDLSGLAASYQRLIHTAHTFFGQQSIYTTPVALGIPSSQPAREMSEFSDLLLRAVDTRQSDKACQLIDEHFVAIQKMQGGKSDACLAFYHFICDMIVQRLSALGLFVTDIYGSESRYFYDFNLFRNQDDLQSWALKTIHRFLDSVEKRKSSVDGTIVRRVKSLIDEKIVESISLTDIAGVIHLHPNYVSRLFSEQAGMSLTSYIIKAKMKKAKEYLHDPAVKIGSIPLMLGYSNPTHFSRLFKREYGMNPSEYRASLSG